MRSMRRLFYEIKVKTGYDIKNDVKVILCDRDEEFFSIQAKMKQKQYRFPRDLDNIRALYFTGDKCIVVSPDVRPGTSTFDMVILHECCHHLLSHEIRKDDISSIKKRISSRRIEIIEAYESIGRRMPRSIEERMCDLFACAICPHIQRGWSKMRRISLEMMKEVLI